jgi:hypothetical protein
VPPWQTRVLKFFESFNIKRETLRPMTRLDNEKSTRKRLCRSAAIPFRANYKQFEHIIRAA